MVQPLTFDEFARPLMYSVLMKICDVPIKSASNPTAKPFWAYYYDRVPKAAEKRLTARAYRAQKLLVERDDWIHRDEFMKRFNTMNPTEFFQEDLTRFTKEMKLYVLRAEYVGSPLFHTGRGRLRQSTPIARSNRSSVHPAAEVENCIICLHEIDGVESRLARRSQNWPHIPPDIQLPHRWACLECHKQFHEACILPWILTSNGRTCPHCRSPDYIPESLLNRLRCELVEPSGRVYSIASRRQAYQELQNVLLGEPEPASHESSVYTEYTVNSDNDIPNPDDNDDIEDEVDDEEEDDEEEDGDSDIPDHLDQEEPVRHTEARRMYESFMNTMQNMNDRMTRLERAQEDGNTALAQALSVLNVIEARTRLRSRQSGHRH